MNKFFLILFVFVLTLGSISAQSYISNVHSTQKYFSPKDIKTQEVKILAVLVEFQADKDQSTFGDGTFGSMYSKDYGTSILDPIPHNVQYFKNHLEFAKNYFVKSSQGNMNLTFDVYDQIIKVSKTIRDYSPAAEDKKDFTPMGNFTKEVWDIATSKGLDLSDYNMFMIFHAGVGGDIIVPGSIGNEKDLPSIFFNLNSLREIFGNSFNGFSYSTGTITNTAILPSTESREITGITGTSLLQLSTNGLIVASIASFLGLPDLYNTKTGISSVGRFALMDGQSIFTYNGIFPPDLSIWEKYFLGWVTPVEVNSDQAVSVVNHIVAEINDTSFVKIPINKSEYFLIENRKRDAKKDGCKVTYKIGDNYYTETFLKDLDNFSYYDVDTIRGVVVDVDEFDWALPGIDSDDEDSFEDIGLLIWHIDERVINENYSTNSINNNKIKGVGLVEADGIFDIGEKFTTIFGDEIIGDGSKEDTWYKGNPAHYYKNRFNDYSKPNSKSNLDAYSLIGLSNFSDVNNKISFNLIFGNDQIKKFSKFPVGSNDEFIGFENSSAGKFFFMSNGKSLMKYSSDGNFTASTNFSSGFKPAQILSNGKNYFISADSNTISVAANDENSFVSKSYTDSLVFSSPVVLKNDSSLPEFYIGTKDGRVIHYSLDADLSLHQISSDKIFVEPIKQIVIGLDFIAVISDSKYWNSTDGITEFSEKILQLAVEESADKTEHKSILQLRNNKFVIISKGTPVSEFSISGEPVSYFLLGDIKKDGNNYLIVNKDGIEAYNYSGVIADNFPIKISKDETLNGNFILADIDNDNEAEIISISNTGKIFAHRTIDSKTAASFPIAGEFIDSTKIKLIKDGNNAYLLYKDKNSEINFIQISSLIGEVFWSEKYGNANNNSLFINASSYNSITDYFPVQAAYNWPNPVYDEVTNIRFFVKENSKAEVKIFDLAGDLIDELSMNAIGGLENEIMWNVKNITSGIYFASLKLKSDSGKSANKVIKIAVVK